MRQLHDCESVVLLKILKHVVLQHRKQVLNLEKLCHLVVLGHI